MDSIRNNKHEVVGFMDDHHVYDNAYGVVGTFAEDTILDMQSQIIARMDGNLIRDHLYRIIGWADAGDIRDAMTFRIIGRATDTGRKAACAAAYIAFFR